MVRVCWEGFKNGLVYVFVFWCREVIMWVVVNILCVNDVFFCV